MIAKSITEHVYALPLGFVNAFMIDDDGLTLIDTGITRSSQKILQAISELGHNASDVRRILVTHCHGDHTGSLAELGQLTGAGVYMHARDAALVRAGQASRPVKATSGLFGTLMGAAVNRGESKITAASVDFELQDGQEVGNGGLRAIHTPGHTSGHLAFLWPQEGGVLFVGDAASHMLKLGLSPIYEDPQEGRRSLAKLAALKFDIVCFSHGKPMGKEAAALLARLAAGG
jgi:glyoxylase-like metal-dependent hydrolase (beta-lactamase superfamily II)